MITVLLLFISNIFMTLAWYGHLKSKKQIAGDRRELSTRIFFDFFAKAGQSHWLAWLHASNLTFVRATATARMEDLLPPLPR